jgi:anti-repressor protein
MHVSDSLINNDDLFEATLQRYRIEKEKRVKLEETLEKVQPDLKMVNQLMKCKNDLSMLEVAKILGMGRSKLMQKLREKGILTSDKTSRNIPYEIYMGKGYFRVVMSPQLINGEVVGIPVTRVTAKGLSWLYKKLDSRCGSDEMAGVGYGR